MGLIGPTSYSVQGSTSDGLNMGMQQSQSTNQASSRQNAFNLAASNTYIPSYSETPILDEMAQYSRAMAPQVYAWGLDQYNKNQGNIDALLRNAQEFASPQRISTDVGMAESGVQQAGEQARKNAETDLASYGIDPSSGRYAQLETAGRVQTAAAAAGAGNQQRMADIAQGNTMTNQAIAASLQNEQEGYGASNALNNLLSTGMSLKFPPLGQTSTATGQTIGSSQSAGQSTGAGSNFGVNQGQSFGQSGSQSQVDVENKGVMVAEGGPIPHLQGGGIPTGPDSTTGGFVSQQLSPTGGARTDDVPAQLNAGEFVIPRDVSEWKGQEFFYKLMAQARKARATAGSMGTPQPARMGYQGAT